MNTIKILFPIDQAKFPVNEEVALGKMLEGITKLIELGALVGSPDDILKNYIIQENTGLAIAEIDATALKDGSILNSVGAGLGNSGIDYEFKFESIPDITKSFSTATITERLRLASKDPKVRMRYLILDYKRYWKSKFSELQSNSILVDNLKNMFLSDMNSLMTDILPYIVNGKQLGTLIGVSNISNELVNISRDLSLAYKRAITANESTGSIPKNIFQKLQEYYMEFMTTLLKTIFPGIESMTTNSKVNKDKSLETKRESRHYSIDKDGRIKLFTDSINRLKDGRLDLYN